MDIFGGYSTSKRQKLNSYSQDDQSSTQNSTKAAKPQIKGQLKLAIYRNKKQLLIHIVEAITRNGSRPIHSSYVSASFYPQSHEHAEKRTKIVYGSKPPRFQEILALELDKSVNNKRIVVSLWSIEGKTSCLVGCTSFGIRHLNESRPINGYYFLLNEEVGCLKHLAVGLPRKTASRESIKNSSSLTPYLKKISLETSTCLLDMEIENDGSGSFGFSITDSIPISVSLVDTGGAAEKVGLKLGDCLHKVNGTDISGLSCRQVVQLIVSIRDARENLSLVVVRESGGGKRPSSTRRRHPLASLSTNTQLTHRPDAAAAVEKTPKMSGGQSEIASERSPVSGPASHENNPAAAAVEGGGGRSTPLPPPELRVDGTPEQSTVHADDSTLPANSTMEVVNGTSSFLLSDKKGTGEGENGGGSEEGCRLLQVLMGAETDFVAAMKRGREKFITPLRSILTPQEHGTLFTSMEEIGQLVENIWDQVQQRRASYKVLQLDGLHDVLSTYKQQVQPLRLAYARYLNGLKRSEDAYSAKMSQPQFRSFLQFVQESDSEQKPRGDLESFIRTPAEHFHELVTLFGEIQSWITQFHPAYSCLLTIIESLLSLEYSAELAGDQSQFVTYPMLASIEKNITLSRGVKPFQLCQPNRNFVCAGTLYKIKRNSVKKVWALLVSDLLILCKQSNGSILVRDDPLPLDSLMVQDFNCAHERDLHITIVRNSKHYKTVVVRAPTMRLKHTWKRVLDSRVSGIRNLMGVRRTTAAGLAAPPLQSEDSVDTGDLAAAAASPHSEHGDTLEEMSPLEPLSPGKKKGKSLAKEMKDLLRIRGRRHTEGSLKFPPSLLEVPYDKKRKNSEPGERKGSKDGFPSLSSLMSTKAGLQSFRDFLKTEYSVENLDFWLACEEYKKAEPSQWPEQAMKIYEFYLKPHAPREVNLDSEIRKQTIENAQSDPHEFTFELAQTRIRILMENDSYARFVKSPMYASLLKK